MGTSRDILAFVACVTLARSIGRAHAAPVEFFQVNSWRMRPCQGTSQLRRQSAQAKPPPSVCWVPPDWVFRWPVAHRHRRCRAPISRKPTITCPIIASFLAKRKWPTSASPPFISSIGKMLAVAVVCSSPVDAVAATAAAAAMVAAVAMVVAVAGAVPVAEAVGAVGSVAAPSLAAWVALAARAAACPGACAACARSDDLTRIQPVRLLKQNGAPADRGDADVPCLPGRAPASFHPIRGMVRGRASRVCAARRMPALGAPNPL